MKSRPRMPRGMSRCGFLVSSAAVATTSKPMKAKKTTEAAVKMPIAEVGGCVAEDELDERGFETAARLLGPAPWG